MQKNEIQNCPVCGTPCTIEGKTTLHYAPMGKETMDENYWFNQFHKPECIFKVQNIACTCGLWDVVAKFKRQELALPERKHYEPFPFTDNPEGHGINELLSRANKEGYNQALDDVKKLNGIKLCGHKEINTNCAVCMGGNSG